MGNTLVNIIYEPKYETITKETEIIEVFKDFKTEFDYLNHNFEITSMNNKSFNNFKEILTLVTQQKYGEEKLYFLLLKGSGNIAGLELKNAFIKYDVSALGELTKYWDITVTGGCHYCHESYRLGYIGEWFCLANEIEQKYISIEDCERIMKKWGRAFKNVNGCPDIKPYISNEYGKPAKKLSELIEETCKLQ